MESALIIVLSCAAFCALPTLLTAGLAWRHRGAWVDWRGSPEVVADDYRASPRVEPRRGVPGGILAVAWASFALGQMFLPGLGWGLYGLLIMGLGLVSIPGLIVAARCFWSGWLMLRRDARAAAFAAHTARWSLWLNAIIMALVLCALLVMAVVGEVNFVPLAISTGLYALASLLHAWSLEWAAARLAAWSRAETIDEATAGAPAGQPAQA